MENNIKWVKDIQLAMDYDKDNPDPWYPKKSSSDEHMSAILRHTIAYMKGDRIFIDSGLPHMAHIAARAMYIEEIDDILAYRENKC